MPPFTKVLYYDVNKHNQKGELVSLIKRAEKHEDAKKAKMLYEAANKKQLEASKQYVKISAVRAPQPE